MPLYAQVPEDAPSAVSDMLHCEAAYSILSVWLWLSFRFPDSFPDREAVQVLPADTSLRKQCGQIDDFPHCR